jgi:hypothetical protein
LALFILRYCLRAAIFASYSFQIAHAFSHLFAFRLFFDAIAAAISPLISLTPIAIICARFTPMPPMFRCLRRCRFSAFTPLPPRQLPPPPLLFHYFAAAAA